MHLSLEVVNPFELQVSRVSIPPLGPDLVLVSILAVGICGTDLEIYDGSLPYLKMGTAQYPIVPGHEWSGRIAAVGESVTKFKVGDLVVGECHQGCNNCEFCRRGAYNLCPDRVRLGIQGRAGACAEYVVTDHRTLHALPAGVTPEEGALVEPATVAFHAVNRVGNVMGRRVAVLGCGPIGLLSLQMARSLGASSILAVDLVEKRVQLAKELGADCAIRVERRSMLEEIRSIVGIANYDAVLEATGDPEVVESALELCRPGADVVLLSLYKGKTSTVKPDVIVTRELRLHGTLASPSVWERTIEMISHRQVKVKPLISHRLSFEDASQAFSIAYNKADGAVKVLIKPTPNAE